MNETCRTLPIPCGRRTATLVAALGLLLLPCAATAEKGGSGHYLPGSMASFIDGVPPAETFLARLNLVHYAGSIGADRPLPIGGVTALGASARSWGFGLTVLWRPCVDLGDRRSWAISGTLPVVLMDVSADVQATLPGGPKALIARSSTTNGLGDVVLMPLMLNYSVRPDFNVNFRVGFYAPSGSYEVGRLANTGKNFWTVEPTVGLMYFGKKNGIEASAFVGADFNSENGDTSYHSGTQLQVDGTLAQHSSWLGGLAGGGLSAYYYQQVTDDSGSGATLGPLRGRTVGLGPALSFAGKVGDNDTIVELKWLHEVDTANRLQGDIIWLKAVYKF